MTMAPSNLDDLIKPVIQENEAFCKSDQIGRETQTEIVELINDAIDHVHWEVKIPEWKEHFPKFAMLNYLFSVLMPVSYAIHFDFLGGNLPASFMQLRVLLEQLAKCFFSDRNYPNLSFFQEKMVMLEAENLTSTKRIEMIEPTAARLWTQLSNDWAHMKYLERIVRVVLERGAVPGYGLVIPIALSDTELPEIEELGQSIAQFRVILANTVDKWKSEVWRRNIT